MKFSKFGRIALASVVSFGLGFGVIACGPSNTIDFLYVTSSKKNPGQINVYKVDSQAGPVDHHCRVSLSSGGAIPSPTSRRPTARISTSSIMTQYGRRIRHQHGRQHIPAAVLHHPGQLPHPVGDQQGRHLPLCGRDIPAELRPTPEPGALVVYPINANGSLGATGSLCTPVSERRQCLLPGGQ